MKRVALCVILLFLLTSITPFKNNFNSTLSSELSNYQTTAPPHSKIVIGYFAQWAIYSRDYNVLDV